MKTKVRVRNMTAIDETIQQQLYGLMERYHLFGLVYIDPSALADIERMAKGKWEHARVYAGNAILYALEHERDRVTVDDVTAIHPMQQIAQVVRGIDSWDQLEKYSKPPF